MKKQRDRVPDSMETQYEESEKDESSSAYSSSEDVGNLKNVVKL